MTPLRANLTERTPPDACGRKFDPCLDSLPLMAYDDCMTCPAPESHRLNAEEAFFAPHPVPEVLNPGEDIAIQALADAEETACEGVH